MEKVIASKENAKKALENLLTQERFMNEYAFTTIRDFLQAAEKKLPSEASYKREQERKRNRRKNDKDATAAHVTATDPG